MATMSRFLKAEWKEFGDRLLADLGGEIPGNCAHDYAKTRVILADMGFDVEESITNAKVFGGNCDCTILLNIDAPSRVSFHYNP